MYKRIFILALFVALPFRCHASNIDFTVNTDGAVVVTGSPRLTLTVGSATKYAVYNAGASTATALVFRYAVTAGDFDADGIAVTSPIDLNSGTIRDAAGNDLALTYTAPNTADVKVQTYQVAFTTDPITSTNETAAAFQMTKAPVGATFDYSISSSNGGTPVTGSGTIATATQNVTGIDVSALPPGTLTVSLTMTDASGTGLARTDDVTKLLMSLNHITSLNTGTYAARSNSTDFTARVERVGGVSWLLIGRGRQGWQFDTDGQGTNADVIANLGTSSAFSPAAYSNAIVSDFITNAGINLTGAEIWIKRAANTGGTSFQDVYWRPISQTTWTWAFDTADYDVEHDVKASILGVAFLDTTGKTRDANTTPGTDSGNNYQRIFTWAWGSHNNQKGFAYGSSVQGIDNNSPTSFIWEFTTEAHGTPYAEVYLRKE
jgi:hypothetical protein